MLCVSPDATTHIASTLRKMKGFDDVEVLNIDDPCIDITESETIDMVDLVNLQLANTIIEDISDAPASAAASVSRITALASTAPQETNVQCSEDSLQMTSAADKANATEQSTSLSAPAPKRGPFSVLKERQFALRSTETLETNPNTIKTIHQNLWVCKNKGVIQIYSTGLVAKRKLKNSKWGDVYDITEMPGCGVVLAGSTGLFHVTSNGESTSEVERGVFLSVASENNRIYAQLKGQSSLSVFLYNGVWVRMSSIDLPFKANARVSLRAFSSRLYVCSAVDGSIKTLSLTGEVVESFGKRGSGRVGHLRDPIVCDVDSAQNVLVADTGNNQLQLYESSAQWSIVKLRPLSSVKEPRGAAVIGDRLYVISRNRKTVSLFTTND